VVKVLENFPDTKTSGKYEDNTCISIVVLNGVDTGKISLDFK